MKRANLILDESLLNKASRLFGEKTYSATVNKALAEAIKSMNIKNLGQFAGSGIWEGNLAEMRKSRNK